MRQNGQHHTRSDERNRVETPFSQDDSVSSSHDDPPDAVHQTIDAIIHLHLRAEKRVPPHQRAVETVTTTLGRPAFLYLVVFLITSWMVYNLLGPRMGMPQYDPPPFGWLQGAISLSALLLTIVVLITQNRQGKTQERRSQLNLQVSLLAEQKIAKLIGLIEELRRDLPIVHDRHDPEADAMKNPTDPHAVVTALEMNLEDAAEEIASLAAK